MVRMYAFFKMIFTFLFLLIVFVRLMSAACECQKTENIDLIAMLTGCENCFQCIQRLMATETDPIRIVIIRYKVTETRLFSFLFLRVALNSSSPHFFITSALSQQRSSSWNSQRQSVSLLL